jgi:hypothetical protein
MSSQRSDRFGGIAKDAAYSLGGLAIFAGIVFLVGLYIGLLPRISAFIYRFANPASGFVFVLDLLILPFAMITALKTCRWNSASY